MAIDENVYKKGINGELDEVIINSLPKDYEMHKGFFNEARIEKEKKMDEEKVYLCFIRLIGEENDGYYRYEFIFTNNRDEVWGEGFEQKPACLVNDLMVSEEYVYEVHIVKMKIKLDLIQNNCCFSVSDSYDGICSIAWENIDELDEFPEEGRVFFKFGETLEEVEDKLAMKNILMLN